MMNLTSEYIDNLGIQAHQVRVTFYGDQSTRAARPLRFCRLPRPVCQQEQLRPIPPASGRLKVLAKPRVPFSSDFASVLQLRF